MPEPQGRHRAQILLAAGCSFAVMVGVYLPWRLAGGDYPIRLLGISCNGDQSFVFATLALASLAVALLVPARTRPLITPLVLGAISLLTSTVLAAFALLREPSDTLSDEMFMFSGPAYGWYVTVCAGALGSLCALLAVRRAVLDAHEVEKEAEAFD